MLSKKRIMSTAAAKDSPQASLTVAGKVINPHRPPTRSGKITVFFSLEDEFGLLDVTMFERQYQRFGQLIFGQSHPVLTVTGTWSDNCLILQHAAPLAKN
ncbi:hypothetical protein MFMK1_001718 [Metallumcola ferriviriculae]|uniref:Uncharacterized protein n=1 Tax=Metallumcola ferriviriculae TaxID=3039180 RepID=A0AAU0UMW5_9FIRM|nr:hypothetical protein MFMK1_001718 [Desulfitibacteraceae bacterium MK1]